MKPFYVYVCTTYGSDHGNGIEKIYLDLDDARKWMDEYTGECRGVMSMSDADPEKYLFDEWRVAIEKWEIGRRYGVSALDNPAHGNPVIESEMTGDNYE